MTEDDRRKLYGSLLRGLANTAQNRLCAEGRHAWGETVFRAVVPDMPPSLLAPDKPIPNMVCRRVGKQICDHCGAVRRVE